MNIDDLVYQYDPEPERGRPAGVTAGWLVVHNGRPGDAWIAKVAMLVGDGGDGAIVVDGEFEQCEVVDDPRGETNRDDST